MNKASLVVTALGALVLGVLAAQARAEATTNTVVLHGVTRSDFNTDICGRLATFTFTARTQVIHLTDHGDGSSSFNFVDTGPTTSISSIRRWPIRTRSGPRLSM